MGKIIVSENLSLDGVDQDPTGEEGFRHGGWFNEIGDADRAAWAGLGQEEALGATAFLLGRRSYEYLAARWPSREGVWADRLNSMPKYVVSSTLRRPEWANSTVLGGEVVGAVAKLKEEVDGEIIVAASHQLVRTLVEHDLVDEFRLVVFPVMLGDGDRLFGPTADRLPLRLLAARAVGDDLALLSYERVRESG
ncbi:MAG TPA: dihydrofolate reductase family protein [Solirubrobacterales bacterium]|nr:dihydrofolate reductase family protein [Solirubrobacterales bacterium]